MSSNTNSISLPWSNIKDVTFINGEDITYNTLNDKIIRLLDNDLTIYKNKVAISNLAVLSYENMVIKYFDDLEKDYYVKSSEISSINELTANYKVNNDTLIWLNDDVSSEFINIVYPIIPIPYPSNLAYPKPKQCNISAYNNIQTYVSNELADVFIDSYDIVLQTIQNYTLSSNVLEDLGVVVDGNNNSTGANVLRYDLAYFASFNKSINYQLYYEKGFRWAEAIISKACLDNINLFTDNVKLPYFSLAKIENSEISSTQNNEYDLVTNYDIEQHIINNNTRELLNSFTDGYWCKQFGSGWLEQGGIIQVIPDPSHSIETEIPAYEFTKPYSTCLNVQLSVYNNTKPEDIVKNESSKLTVCPVYVKEYTNTGFTVSIKPDYLSDDKIANGTKTLNEFNILWKATGII